MTPENSKSKSKYGIEKRNDDNDDSKNISPVTSIVFSMLLPTLISRLISTPHYVKCNITSKDKIC
jgi:hypothetical protein